MNDVLDSILGHPAIERFWEDRPVRRGLPAAAYTGEDFFKLEQERAFARNWTLAGFAHELAEPGDAVPATVAGAPILLVRGKDAKIRAFHNVCRHRGLKLVERPCRGKRNLVCPYHAWTYGLDGRLLGAPHFGGHRKHTAEGFDYETHGLVEVPLGQWHDWLFVNVAGNAADFDSFLSPLKKQLGDLDLSRIKPLYAIDSGTFECNWKFICENFVEPYHVPVVHPETAAGQPLNEHYMVRDGHLVGCAVDVKETPAEQQRQARAREVCLDISARYLLLFPNFLFFLYLGDETQVNVMLNTPVAPGRTHQRRVIYQLGGTPPPPETIEKWRALTNDLIAEDRAMVERLQEGRRSPILKDGGVLSPVWEKSEHAFQSLVMEAVG